MTTKYKGIVSTSKWQTDRVNGGVSGVGCWRVDFEIDEGEAFSAAISRFERFVDESKLERTATGYSDQWTGATTGCYSHPCELEEEEVLPLLAYIFEYEGQPLNPYRFQPDRMVKAIRAYARLANKDINMFVRGCLYPLPHPSYKDDEERYIVERAKVLAAFEMQP